jgi:hypothetical protein
VTINITFHSKKIKKENKRKQKETEKRIRFEEVEERYQVFLSN